MALVGDLLEMARLENILEPGETPILRLPSPWRLWLPVTLGTVGLFDFLLSVHGLATGSGDFLYHMAHTVAGVAMVSLGIVMGRGLAAWQILATDRRLLQRTLNDRGQFEEIPLAGIDEVRPYRLGDGLFVIAGDRKIILPCNQETAGKLRAAIDAAKGGASP